VRAIDPWHAAGRPLGGPQAPADYGHRPVDSHRQAHPEARGTGDCHGAAGAAYNGAMNAVDAARLDRSAFQIGSLNDDREEVEYWRAKTPQERMEALELMRQIIYGYDPATTRLQRVFEVVKLERS